MINIYNKNKEYDFDEDFDDEYSGYDVIDYQFYYGRNKPYFFHMGPNLEGAPLYFKTKLEKKYTINYNGWQSFEKDDKRLKPGKSGYHITDLSTFIYPDDNAPFKYDIDENLECIPLALEWKFRWIFRDYPKQNSKKSKATQTNKKPKIKQKNKSEKKDRNLITTKQAAKMFNVGEQTIRKWCQQNKLEHIKNGTKYLIRKQMAREFYHKNKNTVVNKSDKKHLEKENKKGYDNNITSERGNTVYSYTLRLVGKRWHADFHWSEKDKGQQHRKFSTKETDEKKATGIAANILYRINNGELIDKVIAEFKSRRDDIPVAANSGKPQTIAVSTETEKNKITIAKLFDWYFEDKAKRKAMKDMTIYNKKSSVKSFKEYFADSFADELTTENIQEYMSWRIKVGKDGRNKKYHPIGERTQQNIMKDVRSVFNYGIERNVITNQPVDKVNIPRGIFTRKEYLMPEEVQKLRTVMPPDLLFYMDFLWLSGRRRDALRLARWEDYDPNKKELNVQDKNQGYDEKFVVYLNDYMIELLEKEKEKRSPSPKDYIFISSRTRKGWSPSALSDRFKKSLNEAGIERNVTFHDQRRTIMNILADRNIASDTCELFIGHELGGSRANYNFLTRSKAAMCQEAIMKVLFPEKGNQEDSKTASNKQEAAEQSD